MNWERLIYRKYKRWGRTPRISLTKRGQVTWNVNTQLLLKNPAKVFLMITPDGMLLGIRKAPADHEEAFPVSVNKVETAFHIRAKSALLGKNILPEETKAYPVVAEKGVCFIELQPVTDDAASK